MLGYRVRFLHFFLFFSSSFLFSLFSFLFSLLHYPNPSSLFPPLLLSPSDLKICEKEARLSDNLPLLSSTLSLLHSLSLPLSPCFPPPSFSSLPFFSSLLWVQKGSAWDILEREMKEWVNPTPSPSSLLPLSPFSTLSLLSPLLFSPQEVVDRLGGMGGGRKKMECIKALLVLSGGVVRREGGGGGLGRVVGEMGDEGFFFFLSFFLSFPDFHFPHTHNKIPHNQQQQNFKNYFKHV